MLSLGAVKAGGKTGTAGLPSSGLTVGKDIGVGFGAQVFRMQIL